MDYTGTSGEITLASSTGADTFNNLLLTDVYDEYCVNPTTDGLVGFTPSKEINLPTDIDKIAWMIDNFNTSNHLKMYPRIAKTMGNYSNDGLTYTIEVRDDVYWHDGHRVDAWDVAFSFQARLIPGIARSSYTTLRSGFGTDDKVSNHGNYSFVILDQDSDDFYETVEFHFVTKWAPFLTNYLGLALIPEHILGDPITHGFNNNGDFDPLTLWQVPPRSWDEHSTNTANPNDAGHYGGPIGCGAFVFYNRDSITGTITLRKFDGIKWDDTAWVEDPSISHYLKKQSNSRWNSMVNKSTVVITSTDRVIGEMRSGNINILDPKFDLNEIFDGLESEEAIHTIQSSEPGWQGVFFNPRRTIETDLGADDRPLNRKGVRHAISHMIPRTRIVEELLLSFGLPNYTPIPRYSCNALPEAEFIDYKRTIRVSDGSLPEKYSETAYDEYNIDRALAWLRSEGYGISRNDMNLIEEFITLIIIYGLVFLTGIAIAVVYQRLVRFNRLLDED
jgi:ABC-type transport system substrate-binding protein